jgi:hypothetical protein
MASLYCKESNLEFYNIHKNGQTTILNNFSFKWTNINDIPKERDILCILRNPYDRVISAFIHIQKNHNRSPRCGLGRNNKKLTKKRFNEIFNKKINISFRLFLEEIYKNGHFDHHSIPQVDFLNGLIKTKYYKYINSCNRNIDNATIILDTENINKLEKKYNIIINPLNVRSKIYNKTMNKKNLINDNKELINKIYKDDFLLYNKYIN